MPAATETIAALATAPGAAALGVIRVSGPAAFDVVRAIWPALGDPPESHRARVARLRDGNELLDEALVLPFVAPRSFTGEHVVELHCHGGPVTLQRVLDAVLRQGAKPADAGAFSRQALQNGKLDLVQVEAIADLVHAESTSAQRLALDHLAGRLSAAIDGAKEELTALVALVEAAIDFSLEEHVYSLPAAEIVERATPVRDAVAALLATYDDGRLRADGVRVAIVGRPNAGKSTLLNHLLGEDRALVTDIAGTTRDYLEEAVVLDGVRYHLVDTAGLRATEDAVEALGIERARAQMARADAALLVADASEPDAALELRAELGALPHAVLWNKVDLLPGGTAQPLPEVGRSHRVSLRTGEGVETLPELLRALAGEAGLDAGRASVLIHRARHRELLQEAEAALERALTAAEAELGHELVAVDLQEALVALGGLTGAVTSDDVLARIFSDFCIGK